MYTHRRKSSERPFCCQLLLNEQVRTHRYSIQYVINCILPACFVSHPTTHTSFANIATKPYPIRPSNSAPLSRLLAPFACVHIRMYTLLVHRNSINCARVSWLAAAVAGLLCNAHAQAESKRAAHVVVCSYARLRAFRTQ